MVGGGAPPSSATHLLEAAAFHPATGLGRVLRSPRSLRGELASSARAYGSHRASALAIAMSLDDFEEVVLDWLIEASKTCAPPCKTKHVRNDEASKWYSEALPTSNLKLCQTERNCPEAYLPEKKEMFV
ncbi:hypothetical protein NDU88_003906 [Pleurodeles waltl]|uniref:Uncharacterized protein n=1 Tax=Pleurodeles waltl TaxID=8319 RepID=A0AAV7SH87_PLEWA|nr:hypothetical protein NDU88_003906 [Pleurodeles waltl]